MIIFKKIIKSKLLIKFSLVLGAIFFLTSFSVCSRLHLKPSYAQTSFRFVSWADTKTAVAVLSTLSDQIVSASLNPVFTIYPGDLEEDGFTKAGMDNWKKAINGELTGSTTSNAIFEKTFPVRGNHDNHTGNTAGWQNYFAMSQIAQSVGVTNYRYMSGKDDLVYSFDYGNSHFVGLDALGSVDSLGSDQVQWLDSDLTAAQSRGLIHAFIFFHGPIYCLDGHCSCTQRTCSSDRSTRILELINVFNNHQGFVTATFHGHEHIYTRTYIDNSRIPEVSYPFYQFVTGDAGAGPQPCNMSHRYEYCLSLSQSGAFVSVDVSGDTVTVNWYKRDSSQSQNTFSFTKTGGTPPPSSPTPGSPTPTPIASPTPSPPPGGGRTANPNALLKAKQLLDCFYDLPNRTTDKVIPGQNLAHNVTNLTTGYNNFVVNLYNQTGKWPGLIGADYGSGVTLEQIYAGNKILTDYWNQGGLITISSHSNNPWTGGNYKDVSVRPIKELVDPTLNPTVYNAWRAELDKLAAGLKQLQDAGVIVLWRPFHEMTYKQAFWWDLGAYPDNPEPYKALWKDMFNYFTHTKQLNNLLWVYATADRDDITSATTAYPGPEYVDIVGVDFYSNSIQSRGNPYAKLIALGKPFAITETGPGSVLDGSFDNRIIINSIKTNYPKTIYFLVWHSWTGAKVALVDNQYATELLNDSWVANRGELVCPASPSPTPAPPTPAPSPTPPPNYDLNNDGQVKTDDMIILLDNWGPSPTLPQADLNKDGPVNSVDYTLLFQAISPPPPLPTPTPITMNIEPVADATVKSSDPITNFGSASSLEVDNIDNLGGQKDFYLKFTVYGLPPNTPATQAKIRLYCFDSSNQGGTFSTTSESWEENQITWNNKPSLGTTIGSLTSVSSGSWYEMDVTSAIQGNGTYSFGITSNSANGADYNSKEADSNHPELVISY